VGTVADTAIEWTDKTSRGEQVPCIKPGAVVQESRGYQMPAGFGHSLDPGDRVAVALGAIARQAGGHDVAWLCLSAERHWDHVVDRGCWSTAGVGAQTVGGLEDALASVRSEVRDTTAPSRRSTLPGPPSAIRVPLAGSCSDMVPAQSQADLVDRKPRFAGAAPCEPGCRPRSTLSLGRADGLDVVRATPGLQSISAGRVRAEPDALPPVAAAATPLPTSRNAQTVFGLGDAAPCRCGSDCAIGTSHGGSVSCWPDNSGVGKRVAGRTWDEFPGGDQ
jgi:hypothetical protein